MSNLKFDSETVERYLFDQLSPGERDAFQFELMKDEQLRKEVASARTLQKMARAKIGKNKPPARSGLHKWFPLIAALMLSAVAVFLWNRSSSNVQVSPPTMEPARPPIDNSTEKPIAEERTVPEKTEAAPGPKNITTKNEKEPGIEKAIAVVDPADLVPNEYLEQFVSSGLRSNELSVDIEEPLSGSTLKRENEWVELKIKGTAINESAPQIVLHIFSNKTEDFNEFRPKLTTDLPLISDPDTGSEHTFDFALKVDFTPGLYYFTLETKDDGEMAGVGKFFVK